MTSFAGSEALLRENPASRGVKWPLSAEDTGQLTVAAAGEPPVSERQHASDA